MSLNPSEKKFFEQLAEAAKAAPQRPLEEISLAELREGVSVFKDYAGQEADVPKISRYLPHVSHDLVQIENNRRHWLVK